MTWNPLAWTCPGHLTCLAGLGKDTKMAIGLHLVTVSGLTATSFLPLVFQKTRHPSRNETQPRESGNKETCPRGSPTGAAGPQAPPSLRVRLPGLRLRLPPGRTTSPKSPFPQSCAQPFPLGSCVWFSTSSVHHSVVSTLQHPHPLRAHSSTPVG